MDDEKLRTAGTHFLEFAFSFLTFAKCQYQSANHIKNQLSSPFLRCPFWQTKRMRTIPCLIWPISSRLQNSSFPS